MALLLAAVVGVAAGHGARAQGAAPEGNAAAWSDDLPLAAGGDHLWLAAHGKDDDGAAVVKLFHADSATPGGNGDGPESDGGWEAVVELHGVLSGRGTAGMAASGDRLWLLFRNGPVQAIRLEPGPLPGDWRFSSANVASLPRGGGVEVMASAAGGGAGGGAGERLWVLMRGNSAEAFAAWDSDAAAGAGSVGIATDERAAEDPARRELNNLVLRLPRNYPTAGAGPADGDGQPATRPTELGPATQPATQPQAAAVAASNDGDGDGDGEPVYRLAVLDGGTWTHLTLPEGWEPGRAPLLAAPVEPGGRPTLIARPDRGSPERFIVFQPGEDDGWTRSAVTVHPRGDVRALRVAGQLVLVQHHPTADGFMARFFLVRGGRAAALGEVVLDLDEDSGRWAAVTRQGIATVAAGPATLPDDVAAGVDAPDRRSPVGPTLAGIDLQGQSAGPAVTLRLDDTGPLEKRADFFIMAGVIVVATLLLFAFWRRDPLANQSASGEAATAENVAAGPSLRPQVTKAPTASSAASLTTASTAMADTMPSCRSPASRRRVPKRIVKSPSPAATPSDRTGAAAPSAAGSATARNDSVIDWSWSAM